MKIHRLWSFLRASWWVVPTLCMAAAIGLSLGVETIDRRIAQDFSAWYLFGGGPEGARSLLSVVATSVLAFSGLVFSITVLRAPLSAAVPARPKPGAAARLAAAGVPRLPPPRGR